MSGGPLAVRWGKGEACGMTCGVPGPGAWLRGALTRKTSHGATGLSPQISDERLPVVKMQCAVSPTACPGGPHACGTGMCALGAKVCSRWAEPWGLDGRIP